MPNSFSQIGDAGATLTQSLPSLDGGPAVDTWRGPAATLSTWMPAILAAHYAHERVTLSLGVNSAVATLTVTRASDDGSSGSTTATDVKTPTLTLSMSTVDRPIETIASPTNFAAIAPARIVELRKMVNTGDRAAVAALTGAEAAYAKLYTMGYTSRPEPMFSAAATRYIRLDKDFTASVGSPTAILSWSDVVDWLGNAAANYIEPMSGLSWRAVGMTIAIREERFAEVGKVFEGAAWYPPELFGGN